MGSGKTYKYSTIAQRPKGEIPKAYVLPYLPDVLDQGSVSSCVAHSIAGTFQAQSPEKKQISVLEVYGLWRKHRGEGMFPETAFDLGRTLGTPIREIAPENIEVPEAISKAKEYLSEYPEEFKFRVGSFYEINKDNDFNVNYELVKMALLQFNAPLLAITQGGTHCEICIGWVDKGEINPITKDKAREDAFLIQNSWGNIPYPRRDEKISKVEEMFVVLMNKIEMPFTDCEGHWAKKYIEKAYFAGYLNGRTATEFEPEGVLKRGEAAKLLSEILTRYDEKIIKLEERIRELEK